MRLMHAVNVAFAIAASLFATTSWAQATYAVIDIGAQGVRGFSHAYGLNNAGQVVGSGITSSFDSAQAFTYLNGVSTGLGSVIPNNGSEAYGVNNLGEIVGYSVDGTPRAFLYRNGTMTALFGGEAGYSVAYGINDHGQIVGEYNGTAFVYKDNVRTALFDSVSGGFATSAYAINNAGQIVGVLSAGDTDRGSRALLYANGTITTISPFAPDGSIKGASSWAYAINDAGQVVGEATTENGLNHAFLWQNGSIQDLDTLGSYRSVAKGINSHGQVVGLFSTAAFNEHAFLYQFGTMVDLNALIDDPQKWTILDATGINDLGQISAYACGGQAGCGAVLLSPIPEPTTTLLLIAGLLTLTMIQRVRRRLSSQFSPV